MLIATLPYLHFDLKWFLCDFMIRTNFQVSLFCYTVDLIIMEDIFFTIL